MYSSLYFSPKESEIYCWEYENGVKVLNKHPAPLFFYVKDTNNKDTEYKTIYGDPAKKVEVSSWKKYKDAIERYREWGTQTFESDVAVETKFIISNYLGLELTVPKFDIHFLDIEVHSDVGFPRPEEANHPITIITTWSTKHEKFFIFCEKDFDESFITKNGEKCEKFVFPNEEDMLREYMAWVRNEHPDIISGWNSNGYDIPYIINRARKLFGYSENERGYTEEDGAAAMSPINVIRTRKIPVDEFNFDIKYEIAGINLLDYMEVFQNYTFSEQESWKLGHIAGLELGETKLEYDGSFADLYKDWQKYVEYNVQDVRLLRKLDAKKKFLKLLITFCYGCRVPFEHYVKTTKVLDGAFLSKLAMEKVVLPDVNRKLIEEMKIKNEKYIGGYVKQPEAALHEWTESFDATSLYPSIMMGWNISPETKICVVDKKFVKPIAKCLAGAADNTEELFIMKQRMTISELAGLIKEKNWCMAANGAIYKTDVQGVIGRFVKEWFNMRKAYKKKMLKAKDDHDEVMASEYDGLQHNYKILINSVYGYLGTPHSRLFDWDNAIAVTMTGRAITTTCISAIDGYFSSDAWVNNTKFRNEEKQSNTPIDNTIIYGDTDSLYISFGRILKSYGFNYETMDPEVVKNYLIFGVQKNNADFYDKLSKEEREKLEDSADSIQNFVANIINNSMKSLTLRHFNCPENLIYFKREAVASRAVFLEAKKHYVMWVLNTEGVELEEKKRLKVVGIDIVRSSTPPLVRKELKEVIKNILVKLDRDHTVGELSKMYDKFLAAKPEEIAFPSSVRDIKKYVQKLKEDGKFKSTPMHVRAAILYNQMLEENPTLKRKYDLIHNGEKMKYVYTKTSDKWKHDIFGFKDAWVKELGVEDNINRREQFHRAAISPVEDFFNILGWSLPDLDCHDMKGIFNW
jgi:DNA polymerase elongation subunit (family B)